MTPYPYHQVILPDRPETALEGANAAERERELPPSPRVVRAPAGCVGGAFPKIAGCSDFFDTWMRVVNEIDRSENAPPRQRKRGFAPPLSEEQALTNHKRSRSGVKTCGEEAPKRTSVFSREHMNPSEGAP